MAKLETFDSSKYESGSSVLPAGNYLVMAVESDVRQTKAGTGSFLQIQWQVIDGEFRNRKLFSRLNISNPNQDAVDIANRELGDICRAAGVLQINDSDQLHNIPLVLKVVVEKRRDNGEDSNRIKGYAAQSDGTPNPGSPDKARGPDFPWS